MSIKIVKLALALILLGKNVYEADGEYPRSSALFAGFWGLMAGICAADIVLEL